MSLIGRSSRNHPQQVHARRRARGQGSLFLPPADETDAVDDRRTPDDLFGDLHARYMFTVDAAASPDNAKLPRYWTRETDGLTQDWARERVWCNPPYSQCGEWVAKATSAWENGCPVVVMLLPANRTEQAWWQDFIEPLRDQDGGVSTRFLRGRLRFGRPAGVATPVGGDRPPFGLVVVTWEAV